MTRRIFWRWLLGVPFIPAASRMCRTQEGGGQDLPASADSIATQRIGVDEQERARLFIAKLGERLAAARALELPNSLQPCFVFASPSFRRAD